jgi:hypothetical protein
VATDLSQLLRADAEMILHHTNDFRFRGTPSQAFSLGSVGVIRFLSELFADLFDPGAPSEKQASNR